MTDFSIALAAIFGPALDPARVHMAGFAGDPHVKADTNWFGSRLADKPKGFPDDYNQFVCMGLQATGSVGRSLSTTDEDVALWMDDVGTKVPRDKVDAWVADHDEFPTMIVETSPGNFSYFWRLSISVKRDNSIEARTITAIREHMKREGWGDPGCTDATRYMRFGVGINGKKAYRDTLGAPFALSIVDVNVDRVSILWHFAEAMLGPDWQTIVDDELYATPAALAGSSNERHATMLDPLVQLAAAAGLSPTPSSRAGVIDCSCPNEAAHTHGDPTGYAIINDGMSYCNHSGCQGLRSHDFQDLIVARYEDKMQAAYALGVVIDSPFDGKLVDALTGQPVHMTGGGFMAAIRFEASPLSGNGSEDLEVEALAARMATRTAVAMADGDEARRYWVEDRLIFVNQSGAFWDREDKVLIDADELDRHELVLAHFPLVGGNKRASWQFLNDQRLKHVRTQVRRGFRADSVPPDPIVTMRASNDVDVLAVNTFTPTRVGFNPGPVPQIWLDHLKMLFPSQPFVAQYLHEALCWRLQNPAGLTSIVPAILAGQGVGKDIMLAQFWKLLGEHNKTSIRVGQLAGDFNAFLAWPNIYLDEMTLRGASGKIIYENIKAYTGGMSHVTINGKYSKLYETEVSPFFILTSNDGEAMSNVDPDDRRMFIARSASAQQPKAYYDAFGDYWKVPGNLERLHSAMLAQPMTVFDPHAPAPQTENRHDTIADGLTTAARFVYDAVTEGDLADRRLFTFAEIEALGETSKNTLVKGRMSIQAITEGLKAAGSVKLDRMKRNGVYVQVWAGASVEVQGGVVHRGMSRADQNALRAKSNAVILQLLDDELAAVQAKALAAQDAFALAP